MGEAKGGRNRSRYLKGSIWTKVKKRGGRGIIKKSWTRGKREDAWESQKGS